jgi:hypothetical protein
MMRRTSVAVFSLLLVGAAQADDLTPLCVPDQSSMPQSWRPSGNVQKSLSTAPWSAEETADADRAIRAGLGQMIVHYDKHPKSVEVLWDDSVQSVIEVTYSGSNRPEIQAIGREAARKNLTRLIDPLLKRKPQSITCDDYESTLALTIYAHNLLDKDDPRVAAMVAFNNDAYDECGSLADAMGADYKEILKKSHPQTEEIFELVIWSTWLIEAELVPGLDRPKGASEFSPALWRYLETFRLKDASEFRRGALDEEFTDIGYLATHIAFIPTGYQRHPLYVEDSPNTYRFIRRNLYALMEVGEADLLAEFVDTLRQYGCDPTNDLQVRDGTRYLLGLFHTYGDDWMAYPEPNLAVADAEDYDLIHKAWTGIAGVRDRVWEPAAPGTYGALVRRWLPQPAQADLGESR